ncbi:hypothetical protein ACHQM5_010453 [Ranunculus cassubicifolius]
MAAFSYHNHLPSLLDLSVFLPNNMSGSLEEAYINTTSNNTIYFQQDPVEKQRTESSSIVEAGSSEQGTQMEVTPMEKKRKARDGSCLSSAESKGPKKVRAKKTDNKKSKDEKKKKDSEENPKGGYVHVRARRGEATDSHSLAERVRRERISERLKLLQSLVPGCDKVTSKALMLDEIINYVQSLQNQVEFLSMKLASTSPMVYDLTMIKPEITDITAPFITTNNYPIIDNSLTHLLQQGLQRPNAFYQDNGNQLWSMDEQRQRLLSQLDFTSLCSFQ